MQLLIPLSRRDEPLYRQLYDGLRKTILEETLPTGQKLPSTREIAEQFGGAPPLKAYERLKAEGFATGAPVSEVGIPPAFSCGEVQQKPPPATTIER